MRRPTLCPLKLCVEMAPNCVAEVFAWKCVMSLFRRQHDGFAGARGLARSVHNFADSYVEFRRVGRFDGQMVAQDMGEVGDAMLTFRWDGRGRLAGLFFD